MTTRLTWLELSKLPNGARVAFAVDHDVFPETVIPAGAQAVIEENDLNEIWCAMILRPDSKQIQHDLHAWDGCVYLDRDDAEWGALSPLAVVSS